MLAKLDIPFNLQLLILDEKTRKLLRPVTSLEIFVGATRNFNPDGLFSNEIFGVVGTPKRSAQSSYIDLRAPVIHPVIYKTLVNLKGFYAEIMSGREYARWDGELHDFVRSDMVDGRTGYQFFMEHFTELVIPSNASLERQQAIALYEKYKHNSLLRYAVVVPAGLRDVEIDEYGRITSDKVNELYYTLLSTANTINLNSAHLGLESYNQQRVRLQNTINDIYKYFSANVEGKNNLFMGKWAARKVFNGTRNVITAANTTALELDHPRNMGLNDALAGIYQVSKAMLPITLARLRAGFLDRVFTQMGAPAILTDQKTRQSVAVQLKAMTYADWLSNEGLEKFLTYFKEDTVRHEPIMVENYYLGLTYRGPDGTFAFISGVDQLPEDRSAEHCTPITMAELLYAAIYEVAHTYPALITRYPITGMNSIYPCWVSLRSTVNAEERKPLNTDTWEVDSTRSVAYQFPILGSSFYNSLSPHPSRIQGLGADYDGDMCSLTILYSDEARAENVANFNSKKNYVGTDGRLMYDSNVDTIIHVLRNTTGRRPYVKAA